MTRALAVRDTGPLVLLQDAGRAGLAHLGVPRSGWLDAPAARTANRLVGNPEDAAVLECLLGGLAVVPSVAVTIAVTGAVVPVRVGRRPVPWATPVSVPAGAVARVGAPVHGLRCYVAVSGGFAVRPVLGSRSTDTLSGLGPAPVAPGDVLPVGPAPGPPAAAPADAVALPGGRAVLGLVPGPRADWLTAAGRARLVRSSYTVAPESDRVGLRLTGPPLERARSDELPSEGIVLGAVQVPPDGQPVVFLADHPTTGGYPVVGVLTPGAVARCAQLRPGDDVGFRPA